MKRVLSVIGQVALALFVVLTAGFLIMAIVVLLCCGDDPAPAAVSKGTAVVFTLYMIDMAVLLLYAAGGAILITMRVVRQGQGRALLKSLLIQVPLAVVGGVVLEGAYRLIRDHSLWEGGLMGLPLLFAIAAAVRIFQKWRT